MTNSLPSPVILCCGPAPDTDLAPRPLAEALMDGDADEARLLGRVCLDFARVWADGPTDLAVYLAAGPAPSSASWPPSSWRSGRHAAWRSARRPTPAASRGSPPSSKA